MSHQLIIRNECTGCCNLKQQLTDSSLSVEIINLDKNPEKEEEFPFSIFIVPALIKDNNLLAYGEKDILKKLL